MHSLEGGRGHIKITQEVPKLQHSMQAGRLPAVRGSSKTDVTREDPRSISHTDGRKEDLAKTKDNQWHK